MALNEKSTKITWPRSHYIYVEKKGPFMKTAPAAWQELHQDRSALEKLKNVLGYSALYLIEPEMVYRAGVFLSEAPSKIPAGLSHTVFEGGSYLRFELRGSYAQLPEACGRVFSIVQEMKIPLRNDYYIENYVNDPRTTAEADLITEILVPIR